MRPVIVDLDDHVAALLRGPQLECSFRVPSRQTRAHRAARCVIERVSYAMGERVLDGFQQTLVPVPCPGLRPATHAAASDCDKSRTMRGILEKIFDTGLHSSFHHALAQVGRDQYPGGAKATSSWVGRGGLQGLIACKHQFAHQVHHPIQQRHTRRAAVLSAAVPCAPDEPGRLRLYRSHGAGVAACAGSSGTTQAPRLRALWLCGKNGRGSGASLHGPDVLPAPAPNLQLFQPTDQAGILALAFVAIRLHCLEDGSAAP